MEDPEDMLSLLLSAEFTMGFVALVALMLVGAMQRLGNAHKIFVGLLREFARWDTVHLTPDSLNHYRHNVLQVSSRQASVACSMWARFLESVELFFDGTSWRVSTDADTLARLREDLLASHESSLKVTRLHGSWLAGTGFAGMLLVAFAATLASRDALLSEGSRNAPEAGLAILVSSGGLALICALSGIVASMLFRAFERLQMGRAEQLVDRLVSELRLRIDIRAPHQQLVAVAQNIESYARHLSGHATQWSERLANLTQPPVLPETPPPAYVAAWQQSSSSAARSAADHISESIVRSCEQVVHAVRHSADATLDDRQGLRSVLDQLIDLGASNTRVWESTLLQLRAQSSSLEQQTAILNSVAQWTEATAQRPEPVLHVPPVVPTDIQPIVHALEDVRAAIEDLDQGLEEDVDDLLSEAKETRIAVHDLILGHVSTNLHALHETTAKTTPMHMTMPVPTPADHPKPKRDVGKKHAVKNAHTKAKSPKKTRPEPEDFNFGIIVADMAASRRHVMSLLAPAQESKEGGMSPLLQTIAAALARIKSCLQSQNEARLARYGKAYEPLAQSNTLACAIVSETSQEVETIMDTTAMVPMEPFTGTPSQTGADLVSRLERLETLGASINWQTLNLSSIQRRRFFELWHEAQAELANLVRTPQRNWANSNDPASEMVSELAKHVKDLETLVQNDILDQLTRWPDVLDQARKCHQASLVLAQQQRPQHQTTQTIEAPEVLWQAITMSETLFGPSQKTTRRHKASSRGS
jgi:hypothetical protein